MTIKIQAWAIREAQEGNRIKVTEGTVTYVAIDEERHPRPVRQETPTAPSTAS